MPGLAPTQQFIDIAGIREGLVILKNGSYRLIMSVSAINFSLKSEEEQNSLIFQYQSFLNSLHFPIQIVMRSQRLDLNPYLKKVGEIKDKQTNELIKIQAEDYIDFVSELINLANIMKKNFYVVVGYDPVSIKKPSLFDNLLNKNKSPELRVSDQEFKRYKDEIIERANVAASGLGGMGLRCVQLTTEEIIELFYKIYNPEIADKERFSDAQAISSSFVAGVPELANEAAKFEDKEIESALIDNSDLVKERHEKEAQMKAIEAEKQGQKQVAIAPSQAVATTPPTTVHTPPIAPTNPSSGQADATLPSGQTNLNSQPGTDVSAQANQNPQQDNK